MWDAGARDNRFAKRRCRAAVGVCKLERILVCFVVSHECAIQFRNRRKSFWKFGNRRFIERAGTVAKVRYPAPNRPTITAQKTARASVGRNRCPTERQF